jgi:hypothetical protein
LYGFIVHSSSLMAGPLACGLSFSDAYSFTLNSHLSTLISQLPSVIRHSSSLIHPLPHSALRSVSCPGRICFGSNPHQTHTKPTPNPHQTHTKPTQFVGSLWVSCGIPLGLLWVCSEPVPKRSIILPDCKQAQATCLPAGKQ